ncbi:MAG: sensor histidine kinase, partial [Promicromonosporaceae bacterium]|nr:sensor histidine kinase [Promicromonosporaceae bacterium]
MGPMLMMVVFTHVWSLLSNTRIATGTLFLITAASTVGRWGFLGWDLATLRLIAPQMLMILLFTLGIGFFIYYVIGQADKNATLVRQLRAAQASLALAQHEAGVTAERERVSREIHDTLAQGFMSVVTLSQAARRSLSKGNVEAVERRLALLEGTARENLAEARSLVAGYAPVSLQDATLAEALERLAARLHAEAGHAVTVSLDPDVPELPAPTEVALLRAAQEALTNVRRHANAAAVSIALNAADGGVALIIADDGVGLPPEQAEGYGLTGMRDRVAAVGGTVTVRPTVAGRGTTVIIRIPA